MLYNNIKSICGPKGISISKLERDLEFPRSSICKWNEIEPGVIKVKKVADYLNITIDSLLNIDADAQGKEQNSENHFN